MILTFRDSVLTVMILAVVAWILPSATVGATTQHAAGLVIDTGDRVVTVYVEFPEETITGEELLRRADVDAVFSDEYGSMGQGVCSILGVGSPKEDCFRETERSGSYWNYWQAEDGKWRRSNQGVSNTTVEHGDVDGWAWGASGRQPPYRSFEQIREEHAPEPSPSPTPTPTPTTPSSPAQEEQTSPPPAPPPTTAPAVRETPEAVASTSTPTPEVTPSATAPPPAVTSPTVDPSPRRDRASATPDARLVAAPGDPDAGRGLWSLLTFVAVMGALIGAIVWRRKVRSGTSRGPGGT